MVRMKRTMGPSEKLYPMPVPLIVGMADGAVDVLAAAWIGTVCGAPPTVAVGLRKVRRTLELIEASGELTINIPTTSMAAVVDYCGTVSGRTTDKFAATGLTLLPGEAVGTPIIEQCPYNLECRVSSAMDLGEYRVLLAEVVGTRADEAVLTPDGKLVDAGKLDPLVYIPGTREYRGLGPKVADAYSIGRTVG